MVFVQAVFQLLKVHHIVSFGAAYVAMTCHVLYLSDVYRLEPFGDDGVADDHSRSDFRVVFLYFFEDMV